MLTWCSLNLEKMLESVHSGTREPPVCRYPWESGKVATVCGASRAIETMRPPRRWFRVARAICRSWACSLRFRRRVQMVVAMLTSNVCFGWDRRRNFHFVFEVVIRFLLGFPADLRSTGAATCRRGLLGTMISLAAQTNSA